MSFSNSNTIDDQVKAKLKGDLDKAIQTEINAKYADTLKNRIIKRTRLGVGIDAGSGNSTKLKGLSPGYKKTRKDSRGLNSKTTPAKSNLTATGQLLNSLTTVRVKLQDGIKFVIKVGDNRGRDLDGKPSKVGNQDIVRYQEKQGRKFLGFTKPQINEITREIRQIIIKFLQ